jgi:hypothetical protein
MENIKEIIEEPLAEPEGGGRRGSPRRRRGIVTVGSSTIRDHSPASIHSSRSVKGVE